MCLLYTRENGGLVPVAIQLTQSPTQNSPIYTPADSVGIYNDWLLAKMWVRSADVNHQLYSTHILQTHLIMEPVVISVLRNLPSVHPLYKLLHPHLEHTLATNALYRNHLLPGGKLLSRVMAVGEDGASHLDFLREEFASFQFSSLNVKSTLDKHGLLYVPLLPQYPYPKHATAIWDMTEAFVVNMVDLFYLEDEVVQEDVELQNFLRDLTTNGFAHGAGFPDRFMDKPGLTTFLTTVIFTCTAKHSIVTDGLLDYYGYAPNACPGFTTAPPTYKREKGLEPTEMKKMLPSPQNSLLFTTLMKLMALTNCKQVVCF